jgi:hypothetical protein
LVAKEIPKKDSLWIQLENTELSEKALDCLSNDADVRWMSRSMMRGQNGKTDPSSQILPDVIKIARQTDVPIMKQDNMLEI